MGNYGSSNPQGVRFYVYLNQLGLRIGSSVTSSANSIQPNTWYHVAAARRSGQVKLYINAVQDGNYSLPNPINGSSNFAIGNGPDYTTENFMGTIDEVNVFSKALSADEITALYNDTGLTYYGQISASTGAACPGGSSSLCSQSPHAYLPSRCGFLGQICCIYNGVYGCSGAGVLCNTTMSQPLCQACGGNRQVCCPASPGPQCSAGYACNGTNCA
jgi:hypothetical protein